MKAFVEPVSPVHVPLVRITGRQGDEYVDKDSEYVESHEAHDHVVVLL